MTEAEWLTNDDPFALLQGLPVAASQRKQRLLVLAACERNPRPFWEIDAAGPLAFAAQLAEGTADEGERKRERQRLMAGWEHAEWPIAHYITHTLLARKSVSAAGLFYRVLELRRMVSFVESQNPAVADATRLAEMATLAHDIRDLFGYPFRPIAFDPRWLSETAVALATSIYEQRAFDRMPILADALEDAGCEDHDILTLCRSSGPHARGCWVVDLLLGKS